MSEQSTTIISKVWGMCNPLRDDGVSYGDYLEQLTYLIFLKMSDEYSKPPYKKETGIPQGYTWSDMSTLKGAELEDQYKATLEELAKQNEITDFEEVVRLDTQYINEWSIGLDIKILLQTVVTVLKREGSM